MPEKLYLAAVVKKELLESSSDSLIEYSEMAIDAFLEEGMFKDIPFVGTLVGLCKGVIGIREYILTKNYYNFLTNLKNNSETIDAIQKHINCTDDKKVNKEIEMLLLYLSIYNHDFQAKYLANIYRAYLYGCIGKIYGIKWDKMVTYFELLNRFLPEDFETFKHINMSGAQAENYRDHSVLLRLSSLGLLQYFNGKEESYGHNKKGVAKLTYEGKVFYRVLKDGKTM